MSESNKNIWIVDDDKVYTFGIKKIIRNELPSNKLTSYENGKVALVDLKERLENKEELPDVILLDIDMPEMNGWEFLKEYEKLKARIGKEIQIFVISSRIDGEKEELYRIEWDTKVSDFIRKPVHVEVLKEILSQ